jgi:hypothetical protein
MKDKYIFKTQDEREVAVCIAIQKVGLASVENIIDKVDKWGGKISEKQVILCAENLRRRGLLSIDLTLKENGNSVKRYGMKSIKLSIPEVAQIKDLIDDESINPLKDELDRSKKTQKKGLKSFDYYVAEVKFKTRGLVQGFFPDEQGIIRHYKNSDGVVFYPYHFTNWFRDNLPLINRASSSIVDIKFQEGFAKVKEKDFVKIEKYITNIDAGFHSSKGTGGRGSRFIECLPEGTIVETSFVIPREMINPNRLIEALNKICNYGSSFGGGHKLSTGRLIVENVKIVDEMIWKED